MRLKVLGAGSIGNHVANAARQLHWDVVVCDSDPAALSRMRDSIYPQRYGAWDSSISLVEAADAPRGGFDVIHVGTPPDVHISLAREALRERPRAIIVEKPLCTPSLDGAQALWEETRASSTRVFVGYDHVVGVAATLAGRLLTEGAIGVVRSIDVGFREHWGGILAMHPWLGGPSDSYLGSWQRGGGASGEHSHAANLWQHFARLAGAGEVAEVNAMLSYKREGGASYDTLALIDIRTSSGLIGRVVQDVLTRPAHKRVALLGDEGTLEWVSGHRRGPDAVIRTRSDGASEVHEIEKVRSDDFIAELRHVDNVITSGEPSPVDLVHGLETMLVVAAAHASEDRGRLVRLDRSRGYTQDALR